MNNIYKTILFSEPGSHHLKEGKECEDWVWEVKKRKVHTIALSDGAGSAKYAKEAAQFTAQSMATLMSTEFDFLFSLDSEILAEHLRKTIINTLLKEAQKNSSNLYEYLSTILVASFNTDGRYILFHIGDGAIIGMNDLGECKPISVYIHEGPVNQTDFPVLPHPKYFLQKGKGDYAGILLISDGPEEYLANEIEVSSKVDLLMGIATTRNLNIVQSSMRFLNEWLEKQFVDDDKSYAILIDRRKFSSIFDHLPDSIKKEFFCLSSLTNEESKLLHQILSILSNYPYGIKEKRLLKKIKGIHRPKCLKKKLKPFLDRGIIQYRNHIYYLNDEM